MSEYRIGEQSLFLKWHEPQVDRCIIESDKVSLSVTKAPQSTMINCLSSKIKAIDEIDNYSVLIELEVEEQLLFALVTRWSLLHLKLEVGQVVYANFKVVAVSQQSFD